jgi:hypothetical protein
LCGAIHETGGKGKAGAGGDVLGAAQLAVRLKNGRGGELAASMQLRPKAVVAGMLSLSG